VDGYSDGYPEGSYCSMGLMVATPLSPTVRGIWWLQCL
jgi:hypothetical protein